MRLKNVFKKSLLGALVGLGALTGLSSAESRQDRRPVLSPAEQNAGLELERTDDEPWNVVLSTFITHCRADSGSQVVVPVRIGLDLAQARARNIGPQRRIAMLHAIKDNLSNVFSAFAQNEFVRDKMIYGEFSADMSAFLIAYGIGYTDGRRLTVTVEAPDVLVFGPGCGVPNWAHYAAMRNAHAEFLAQNTRDQENGTLDHSHRGIPDPIDIRHQTRRAPAPAPHRAPAPAQ